MDKIAYRSAVTIIFKVDKLRFLVGVSISKGFPGGSAVKNPLANAGDTGSIPGWGRALEEGNGNPFQYSCLKNPMDKGARPYYSPWDHKTDTTE